MAADFPAFFLRSGTDFLPTPYSRGPWDERSLHGGPVAALIVSQVEQADADESMFTARLTAELLKPVPQDRLTVTCTLTRPGKRVRIYSVTITHDGQVVVQASVLRIRKVADDLPERTHDAQPPFPPPLACPIAPWPADMYVNIADALEIRVASAIESAFGLAGEATCWFKMLVPLVEGDDIDPTSTALIVADFGNGISATVPMATHVYINPDLTVYLHRRPRGEWIANDARTWLHPDDGALAFAHLWDAAGQFGHATQSLYVAAR